MAQVPTEPMAPENQQVQGSPPAPQENPQVQEQQVDPKVQKEVEAYTLGLSKMLHSSKTSPKIVEMLSAGEPQKTIPQIALLVNGQMEQAATKGGKKPSFDVLLGAAQFLVGDLIEMGNAAQIFNIQAEEEIAPILQNTLQAYIEKGLRDKTLDPIELQRAAEPLMAEKHRDAGLRGAEASGLPAEPSQITAMEAYAQRREQKGMLKGSGGR